MDSPWWAQVASELRSKDGVVGNTYPIEELAQMVGKYPGGGAVRPRTAARRLTELGVVELVSRGPNGSLGRGSTFKVVPAPSPVKTTHRADVPDETIATNDDWLQRQIDKMMNDD